MQSRRSTTYASRRSPERHSRNHNSVNYISAVKLGPVTHTVIVALMITVLGLIYLTQATKAIGYDYAASDIESQIAELSVEKNNLEVENARLTALKTIENSSVAAEMSEPSSTDFVR